MTRRLTFGIVTLAVLLSAGCDEAPAVAGPPPVLQVERLDSLRLELALDQAVIPVGDSATVTMRLHNDKSLDVLINFGSTCQILPYVETAGGSVRYPGGGGWICGAALTSLTVPARGFVSRTLVLRGSASTDARPGASLVPGQYRVYALLETTLRNQQLRSPTILFEIR